MPRPPVPAGPFSQVLAKLSPAQREAVEHPGGPLLVVAGAGAGKTRVLTVRTAWLVREQGVDPHQILVATFTNKAAGEFRGRLLDLLGEEALHLKTGTLHATGARLLRQFGSLAGIDPGFTTIGPLQSYWRMVEAAARAGVPRHTVRIARDWVSRFKGQLQRPADLTPDFMGLMRELAADILTLYQEYQALLAEHNELDLDDLVTEAVHLIERVPDVGHRLHLEHVLVDELQDTDPAQWAMICGLLSPRQQLLGVGDGDQAVYGFRGADARIMTNFEQYFPHGKVLALGQNYRSDRRIVAAAAHLIANNQNRRPIRLWSERQLGHPVCVQPLRDDEQEARWVAAEVQMLHTKRRWAWKEMAVLYRANWQSQAIEDQLLVKEIPYQVSGSRFFEREEIQEVLQWLKLIAAPDDLGPVIRLLDFPAKKSWGVDWPKIEQEQRQGKLLRDALREGRPVRMLPKAAAAIGALYDELDHLIAEAHTLPLPELVATVLAEGGIREKWKQKDERQRGDPGEAALPNLDRLVTIVVQFFNQPALACLSDFLTYVAGMLEDMESEDRDAVQLMTLHAAKGREFKAVFIIGVEQGMIPHWQSEQSADPERNGIEEERRLLYVGMTRAQELLCLSYTYARRTASGSTRTPTPSQFLYELPAEEVNARAVPPPFWKEGGI